MTDGQSKFAYGFGLLLAISILLSAYAAITPPNPNVVKLEWASAIVVNQTATNYIIWLGTNSGNYFTNWPVVGTNIEIAVTSLYPGTNFITVAIRTTNPTNKIVSEPSNEIRIYRAAAPVLKVSFSLISATNLAGPWDSLAVFESQLEITNAQRFFAVKMNPLITP